WHALLCPWKPDFFRVCPSGRKCVPPCQPLLGAGAGGPMGIADCPLRPSPSTAAQGRHDAVRQPERRCLPRDNSPARSGRVSCPSVSPLNPRLRGPPHVRADPPSDPPPFQRECLPREGRLSTGGARRSSSPRLSPVSRKGTHETDTPNRLAFRLGRVD